MTGPKNIVICGAGAIGAATAYFLTRRGARPVIVDRARPAAAASGKAAGFLALDWIDGPLGALARASFALHRELAEDLGAERLGYRPTEAIMTAAADEGDLERYRGLANPAWIDGNAVAHQSIGTTETTAQVNPLAVTRALVEEAVAAGAELVTGVVDGLDLDDAGAVRGVSVDGAVHRADAAVLALGPWTSQAQRWIALPQVFGSKGASIVMAADVPAQVVFSEYVDRAGVRSQVEIYPRPDGLVYMNGHPEHDPLPDDPDTIEPSARAWQELHRIAGVHSSVLGASEVVTRSACYRPLTVDGIPLIGPVAGVPGAFLATGHASWGILNAPATGRMVSEMLLDGRSVSLDAAPFAPTRLPAARMSPTRARGGSEA